MVHIVIELTLPAENPTPTSQKSNCTKKKTLNL
jgi:hypothetical protein